MKVARTLSAMSNFNDDNGLMEGKWDVRRRFSLTPRSISDPAQPPFWGGILPLMWSGSLDVYNIYRATGRGVRYGQCWNFAGILTTAGRALGIPSRTITCYNSAHEQVLVSSPPLPLFPI